MPDARTEGLRAAGETLRRYLKRFAAMKTREGARQTHVDFSAAAEVTVSAGYPVGPYGWNPIQASMFDDNRRHPLFGDKKHWYHQGSWPMTEMAVNAGSEDAANAYADAALELMLDEHGFDKYK
jgi:hypothetical protein